MRLMPNWVVVLCASVALGLTACGKQESAADYLEQAKAYIDKAEWKSASLELKSALQLEPTLVEARWQLGQVDMEMGDYQAAEKELLKAQQLGWPEDEVLPELGELYLLLGQFDDVLALDHEALVSSSSARLLLSKSKASLGKNDIEQAREWLLLARQTGADDMDAKLVEARILAVEESYDDALKLVAEVLGVQADNAEAWRLQGDIQMRIEAFAEARDSFTQSIALSPQPAMDRVKRAQINLLLNDIDAAKADADVLMALNAEQPLFNYVQGLLLFQQQQYEQAALVLAVAEPVANAYPMVLYYLAVSHVKLGNTDQASAFASSFVSRVPGHVQGRKLLASLRLLQGDTESVTELLEPVLANYPEDVDALNIQANAYLQQGETQKGLELLSEVAELNPESSKAQLRLGAGLMLSGQSDEASQLFETAVNIDPDDQQADILLVMSLIREGDYDAAIQAARNYQLRNLGSITPYNLLGRVYLAAGQMENALKQFDAALEKDPADPGANLSLAALALQTGDVENARKHYQAILDKQPEHLSTMMQMAALESQRGDPKAMMAWLEKAMDAHPSALEPRIVVARLLLSSGRPDQVSQLFVDMDDSLKESRAVLEVMAMAQLAAKDFAQAHATLEKLVSRFPEQAEFHYFMAMAAGGINDQAGVKQQLNEAYALDNEHMPTLLALAKLGLVEKSQSDFQRYLALLEELDPDGPDVLRLRAVAASLNGEPDQAVEMASRAYNLTPGRDILLELVGYHQAADEAAMGLSLLENWIKDNPGDVTVHMALANEYQKGGETQQAKQQYRTILQLDEKNVLALNNLAWELRESEPQQALAYIRQAAEVAPNNPNVQDTLAVVEYINGNNERAYRAVNKALMVVPSHPSIQYHKAMIEASMGEQQSAISILEQLLEQSESFDERAEAENLLSRLKG